MRIWWCTGPGWNPVIVHCGSWYLARLRAAIELGCKAEDVEAVEC